MIINMRHSYRRTRTDPPVGRKTAEMFERRRPAAAATTGFK